MPTAPIAQTSLPVEMQLSIVLREEKMCHSMKSLSCFALVLFSSMLLFGQQASQIHQKSADTTCSNIVALAGDLTVKCSALTPREKKIIDQIPYMLNKLLTNANQLDPDVVMRKLDEILAASSKPDQTVNAPNGIGIIGGTVINPQVNNFGPPLPNLSWTGELVHALPTDGHGEKLINVHITTDRSFTGARIAIVCSLPVELRHDLNPTMKGDVESQFTWGPIEKNGVPANGLYIQVDIPAVFSPGMEIIVPVESKYDFHVLKVVPMS